MTRFPCPYLEGKVEWTAEREQHTSERHPDLLPEHRERIGETLSSPDLVRRSAEFANVRVFSRWYTELRGGKHVVVVVASGPWRGPRHWIITAYLARKLTIGDVEWERS